MEQTATQHDRTLAALAYVSTVLPFPGIFVPAVMWFGGFRGDTAFARDAIRRALRYHVAWFASIAVFFPVYALSFLAIPAAAGLIVGLELGEPAAGAVVHASMGVPLVVVLGYCALLLSGMALGVVGLVRAVRGQGFRYPLLG